MSPRDPKLRQLDAYCEEKKSDALGPVPGWICEAECQSGEQKGYEMFDRLWENRDYSIRGS